MVKKLKSLSSAQDKQLANAVRNSAQQIWQAGLGAFAKAQEEGGKVFSKLVKEGTTLQKRTRKIAEDKVSNVTGSVSKVAGDVSRQASGSLSKLEEVFEERVSRALASMGVPTQKDIQLLTKRVEQLSKAVAELSGKKAAKQEEESKPRKAAAKTVAKAAADKAPAKAPAKTARSKAKPEAVEGAKAVAAEATPAVKRTRRKAAPAEGGQEQG